MEASGCAAAPKEANWQHKLAAALTYSRIVVRSHNDTVTVEARAGCRVFNPRRGHSFHHLHRRTLICSNPAEGQLSLRTPRASPFRPPRCSSPQASRPGVAWLDPGTDPGPCPASTSCLRPRQQQQGVDPGRVQQCAGSPSCCDRQSPQQQQSQPQTLQHQPARPQPCRS